MSLLVAFSAVAAAVFAYRHRQTLLAQQQQQPQCPRPNFAVLPHEEPVEALQPAPSPLPSLSPASWGSAISSAMWMLFLKRKPLRYHGERLQRAHASLAALKCRSCILSSFWDIHWSSDAVGVSSTAVHLALSPCCLCG